MDSRKQRICDFINKELGVKFWSPSNSHEPLSNKPIDSLFQMKVVYFLEDEFGIKVEFKEITKENFGSIDKIVGFLDRRGA